MIHTVKDLGIVNKAEIDVFLELSCIFDDPADVGNLISGSPAFSITSLNIWNLIGPDQITWSKPDQSLWLEVLWGISIFSQSPELNRTFPRRRRAEVPLSRDSNRWQKRELTSQTLNSKEKSKLTSYVISKRWSSLSGPCLFVCNLKMVALEIQGGLRHFQQ